MSRDVRALGRELRPEPEPVRRSLPRLLLGWLLRHLPEIVLSYLLVRAWQWAAGRVGLRTAEVVTVALICGVLAWASSRRLLFAVGGCLVTRARLRAALAELRLSRRDGRPPVVLGLLPTLAGERVWLLCPVRVSAADIDDERDRLAAACFARAVKVSEHPRWSALVVLDVIRREPREPHPALREPVRRSVAYRPLVTRFPVQVARHRA
jgi:hypothetical protein